MTKLNDIQNKQEVGVALMSLDLSTLRNQMSEISGGWNGSDDKFQAGGEVYTEEDAHLANDIVGKCNELEELLHQWLNR